MYCEWSRRSKRTDYGIAGGKGIGIIFKKGQIIKKVNENILLDEFINILKKDDII